MRIVFMGTPEFAVPSLKALIENGYEVAGVFTQPDRPKGRGNKLTPSPVKTAAAEAGIPVFQPEKIRKTGVEDLKALKPELCVTAAFGQILTKEILTMPKYGCINIHASLLPMYRGAAPIQWVIINGEKIAGVTIMQMDEGLDTGAMLLRGSIELAKDETGDSLHDKLSELGAKLIVEALAKIEEGTLKATPQPEGPLFYAKMLKKEMGNLDYSMDALSAERLIRGLYSWPGAYTYYHGKMLKITSAALHETDSLADVSNQGKILSVSKDSFTVQFAKGSVEVFRVKPEAKKEMSVHDFLLGNHMQAGDFLSRM